MCLGLGLTQGSILKDTDTSDTEDLTVLRKMISSWRYQISFFTDAAKEGSNMLLTSYGSTSRRFSLVPMWMRRVYRRSSLIDCLATVDFDIPFVVLRMMLATVPST